AQACDASTNHPVQRRLVVQREARAGSHRLPRSSGGRIGSAPRHRDVDAADLALGLDLHDLPGAVGTQVQRGGEAGGLDEDVDLAIAGGALQVAENVAALLAPTAGDALALAGDVAG